MDAVITILLAASVQSAAPADATQASAAPQGLHCDARTISGAHASFTWDTLVGGGQALPLITGRKNSAFPAEGTTFALIPARKGSAEDEYINGPDIIRIERDGAVRDLTIWSTQDKKPFVPIAYGYCVAGEISAPITTPPVSEKKWSTAHSDTDGCYLTTVATTPRYATFTMNSDVVDKQFNVTFTGLTPEVWAAPVTLPREMLAKPPKAEHKDIIIQVARFAPAAAQSGPKGMEVSYIEKGSGRISMLVKFNDVDGTGRAGFGICGLQIARMEAVK